MTEDPRIKAGRAILLAYDYHPAEGGIQTLMCSMVEADCGITWTVLTRRATGKAAVELPCDVVRTAIRPQLRLIDKLWAKRHGSHYRVEDLVAFQTRGRLRALCRHIRPAFLLADQYCTASVVRNVAGERGIPWGMWVYGKELLKGTEAMKDVLSSADLVLACSRFARDLALSMGAASEKAVVVHPMVDDRRFHPPVDRDAARRALSLEGRRALLTVAHLVPRKGHEQILRALPRVRAAFPDVIYLVVGRGSKEGALRNLARELSIEESVHFCGCVSDRELPDYYGAADLHVMPSTEDGDVEGFGISLVEAAACGTPSIGSRSGGIPDAIDDGHTGLLVKAGDVAGLGEVIMALLGDDKRRHEMAIQARQAVRTRFSEKPFAKSLAEAFRHLRRQDDHTR